jgi:beta-galactosidase/beta-glucuronidase
VNLNGTWEFACDAQDRGLAENWPSRERLDRTIVVPFAYQTALSGIGDTSICEVVWYARNFEVPANWEGHDHLLHFGSVDYEATVWVNGQEVGFHRGGHVPFSIDVTEALTPGANRVCLRVVDRQARSQPRGKQSASGTPHGIDYYCTTGIWQTVWLEPVPTTYLGDVVVSANLEAGVLAVRPIVHGGRTNVEARVEVYDGGTLVARGASSALSGEPIRLSVSNPVLWTPERPHLYDLAISLWRNGEKLDEVRSYAGMRSVGIQDGRFVLNGEPTYLRLVLDQGYWPDGGLTAPTDEALRVDIEWVKRLGFNGVRKHQKVEDPRWLYWCDKLGLLVWGEMANAREWSHEAQLRLEAEWSEAVIRDRSHPCVIAWVPVNESMGYDRLEAGDAAQRNAVDRLVHLTRELDPTRPVIDNDGWEQNHGGDIVAIHDYSHTGADLAARYADVPQNGSLPPRIWSGSRCSLLPGVDWAGRPVMLTEVGGFLTRPDVPEAELDVLYRIYDSIDSPEVLGAKYTELVAAIGTVPFVAGFCYTQLTDIEQELNGLLTYDRRPKVDVETVAAANRNMLR